MLRQSSGHLGARFASAPGIDSASSRDTQRWLADATSGPSPHLAETEACPTLTFYRKATTVTSHQASTLLAHPHHTLLGTPQDTGESAAGPEPAFLPSGDLSKGKWGEI